MRETDPNGVATQGAYSYPVAATYLGVSAKVVATWSNGYTRKVRYSDDRKSYAPVLQTEHERGYVTFLELVELIYCREFRRHGVSLATIRAAAENLAREVGPYPFATRELVVHGRALVERLGEDLGLDAASRQVVFDLGTAIKPNVAYDATGRIGRMYVATGNAVLLDPRVRFGEPVLTSRPVPTRAIASLYRAEEGRIETVADYFGISEREVEAAVGFESAPGLFTAA